MSICIGGPILFPAPGRVACVAAASFLSQVGAYQISAHFFISSRPRRKTFPHSLSSQGIFCVSHFLGAIEAGSSLKASVTTSSTSSLVFFFSHTPTFLPRAASSAAFSGHVTLASPLYRPFLPYTSSRHYAKSRKMPPKKTVVVEKLPLGRPGNSLTSGIVSDGPAARRGTR